MALLERSDRVLRLLAFGAEHSHAQSPMYCCRYYLMALVRSYSGTTAGAVEVSRCRVSAGSVVGGILTAIIFCSVEAVTEVGFC